MRRHDDHDEPPGDDRQAEEVVWLRQAQRDVRAFEPIYTRYYRPVFGFCYRRLGDRDEALDATSQTFTKAIAGLSGFRGGSVAGWLFAIARNHVHDVARGRRRHLDLDAALLVIDETRGPPELTVARDQRRALQAALEELTPDQRDVVELRLAGLTNPEIARSLDISISAMKSCQFRSYSQLRKLLTSENVFEAEP